MLRNYVIVALRNIRKYRMFSFINIFGLALAMSVCLLIILMLNDQARYDNFHTKKDRIYRVMSYAYNGRQPYATSPFPTGDYLVSNYAVVEDAVTMLPSVTGDVTYGQRFAVMKGYFTGPSFFNVFDFGLTNGDAATALSAPRSVVISKQLAERLFLSEDPLGKSISFSDRQLAFPVEGDGVGIPPVDWGGFTVTGVFDMSERRSHLGFDVLMSAATLPILYAEKKVEDLTSRWDWYFRPYNYVLLREGKTADDLTAALADVVKLNDASLQAEHAKNLRLDGQLLGDIQLGLAGNDTNMRMPIQGYYLLGILAIVIMISACLNYTNLSIARALTRAKEIGVRKVTGAGRSLLITQFLGESIIVALIALAMAVLMLQLIRPVFMSLWINKYLRFELPSEPIIYLGFVGFAVLIGLIAGVFPALKMSAYQPIVALKKQEGARASKGRLRKILSVSQFSVSLLFITTAILIFNQFNHYISFDYGMKTENIVNVDIQGHDYRKVANELSQIPGVTAISASDLIPATGRSNGHAVRKPGEESFTEAYVISADESFIGNLGLKLIAGTVIAPSSDSAASQIIVNEQLVRKLGYDQPASIIGETIESKWEKQPFVVTGVVSDFMYKLPINKTEIEPLIIFNRPGSFQYVNVKFSTKDYKSLRASIENTWKRIDPLHPVKYQFYDDELAETHQAISDIVTILGFISFLAVVIACLGLLGMATYMAERRKKEVGIRKVLGAADWGITVLLSKSFLKVLGLSVLIGAPMSYFLNNLWLEHLPNRVEFGIGTVLIAVSMLTLLGILTIGSQTIGAAKMNPAETLKEE
jgi:putative ABC transport system permease protein